MAEIRDENRLGDERTRNVRRRDSRVAHDRGPRRDENIHRPFYVRFRKRNIFFAFSTERRPNDLLLINHIRIAVGLTRSRAYKYKIRTTERFATYLHLIVHFLKILLYTIRLKHSRRFNINSALTIKATNNNYTYTHTDVRIHDRNPLADTDIFV